MKLLIRVLFFIFGGIPYSFGQETADSAEHGVLVKNSEGEVLTGVYMVNKTQHYLITSSDEKGYCYFDVNQLKPSDSIQFACLGFYDLVMIGQELLVEQEIHLVEKRYELEGITIKNEKPDVLLKKASVLVRKRAKFVKKNYNYYGKGQYLKITECHGKAVEYQKIYGVFFTSGNMLRKDILDENYRWDFIPAWRAQSLPLTADGKDTLFRRRVLSNNLKKLNSDYDAGVMKLPVLIRSIMLYGPLFTDLKYYDFRLIDNTAGYTYEFRTKNTDPVNNMRIRCNGTLTIDPETAHLTRLVLNYVDYNLFWRRLDEWVESPYLTRADIRINFGEDGLPYVESCVQETVWKKNWGYGKSGEEVWGLLPSRRGAARHHLIEKEFFKAYSYRVYPEYYRHDERFYFILRDYNQACFAEYKKDVFPLIEWADESVAKKDLSSFMDIEKQFECQRMAYYTSEDVDINSGISVPKVLQKEVWENIIEAFVTGESKKLVLMSEGFHTRLGVR